MARFRYLGETGWHAKHAGLDALHRIPTQRGDDIEVTAAAGEELDFDFTDPVSLVALRLDHRFEEIED